MTDSENVDNQPKGTQSPPPHRDKIKGIFSTQSVVKVGTGTTTRRIIQKTYWFVEEVEENSFDIQPLNKNYIPSGPKRKITIEDLLTKFAPEPEFYISTVYPKMQELQGTIQKGERHRQKGEIFSAEMEFHQALQVDEENVRANFGLGLTYLDRGEAHKANDIFERLVRLEAAFDTEHKHLFNDFGISLRKNKMLDQSLEYYHRAETLTDTDENLYLNMARAYYEKQDYPRCLEYLKKALGVNPNLNEALLFIQFLVKKKYISPSNPEIVNLLPKEQTAHTDAG
jgi:tetratricopeptide (TPR) repeat protein